MPENSNQFQCPADCPNHRAEKKGKIAAYIFGIFTAAFLSFQCVSYERRGEAIPPAVFMPLLMLTGASMGVSVRPADIAGAIATLMGDKS